MRSWWNCLFSNLLIALNRLSSQTADKKIKKIYTLYLTNPFMSDFSIPSTKMPNKAEVSI